MLLSRCYHAFIFIAACLSVDYIPTVILVCITTSFVQTIDSVLLWCAIDVCYLCLGTVLVWLATLNYMFHSD